MQHESAEERQPLHQHRRPERRAMPQQQEQRKQVTYSSFPEYHDHPPPTSSVASTTGNDDDDEEDDGPWWSWSSLSLRQLALKLSLYLNLIITITKLVAYLRTFSLSVLAALLDSVLDVVSQAVLNYTEKHSHMQRSSAQFPAGASRLEPIGVLTCAALMGMASFEVIKESAVALIKHDPYLDETLNLVSFWTMLAIVVVKLGLWTLCNKASNRKTIHSSSNRSVNSQNTESVQHSNNVHNESSPHDIHKSDQHHNTSSKAVVQLSDPTLDALAQDHWNDALSNAVAAFALVCALKSPTLLWFVDPVGAIFISIYIIHSWYLTGAEQIEHLTGKAAPADFIEELREIAENFDERIIEVDHLRVYHFGPKYLVEIEMVMPKETLLFESHDIGMELQYEIEGREEIERCFVHIDYETRPYDEHVVSKVPELREKYRPSSNKYYRSSQSV